MLIISLAQPIAIKISRFLGTARISLHGNFAYLPFFHILAEERPAVRSFVHKAPPPNALASSMCVSPLAWFRRDNPRLLGLTWPRKTNMRRLLVYALILAAFGLGISLTLKQGRKLPIPQTVVSSLPLSATEAGSVPGVEPSVSLVENLRENLQDPLTRLFVQLILIIVVARLCGALTMTIRQPAVVGEMIAGILLGPSLLGWLWPDV